MLQREILMDIKRAEKQNHLHRDQCNPNKPTRTRQPAVVKLHGSGDYIEHTGYVIGCIRTLRQFGCWLRPSSSTITYCQIQSAGCWSPKFDMMHDPIGSSTKRYLAASSQISCASGGHSRRAGQFEVDSKWCGPCLIQKACSVAPLVCC